MSSSPTTEGRWRKEAAFPLRLLRGAGTTRFEQTSFTFEHQLGTFPVI